MRLSEAQERALRVGSDKQWLGAREVGVPGDTMAALERRGLAEVRIELKPYERCVYRLTAAGVEEQRRRVPLSELTEDELIARYTTEAITLGEYTAERERRSKLDDEREMEAQKKRAYEQFLHAGSRNMPDLDLRAAAHYAQHVGDRTAEREINGELAYREGRAA